MPLPSLYYHTIDAEREVGSTILYHVIIFTSLFSFSSLAIIHMHM